MVSPVAALDVRKVNVQQPVAQQSHRPVQHVVESLGAFRCASLFGRQIDIDGAANVTGVDRGTYGRMIDIDHKLRVIFDGVWLHGLETNLQAALTRIIAELAKRLEHERPDISKTRAFLRPAGVYDGHTSFQEREALHSALDLEYAAPPDLGIGREEM